MLKKKNIAFFVLVMFMMIAGGYYLGVYIGNNGFEDNINKSKEEPGYQAMQSESKGEEETIEGRKMISLTDEDTLLVFQKNYILCNHQRTEERKAENVEIGLRRQDFAMNFPEWNIYEFSQNKVILTKEIDDYCPGHFILRDEGGKLVIYMPSEQGEQYKSIENTGILTEMLPHDVQEDVRRGLIMDSLEEVEHFMENWES
ncbi:MAG TPA: hypothetical protein VFD57_04975 [Clostridia bacterium]|nr:hypothetical protein [Clostridia bacterium]